MRDETVQIDETVREAFGEEGIVLKWHLTAEIESSRGKGRYLAHRACDVNGEQPQLWDTIGLLESSLVSARVQLEAWTMEVDDEEQDG